MPAPGLGPGTGLVPEQGLVSEKGKAAALVTALERERAPETAQGSASLAR